METIDTVEQIVANVLRFDAYRVSNRPEDRQFFMDRLRLGKIFVVAYYKGAYRFCPSRFAGYKNNTMSKHVAFEYKSGSVTTPRISLVLGYGHVPDTKAEKRYLAQCGELSARPSGKARTYWPVELTADQFLEVGTADEEVLDSPDEVPASASYAEGAVKQVLINAYERSPEARRACLEHYGAYCCICSFNFESVYGALGSGFIHVHHLVPLALQSGQYSVDPLKDLRPVCPNCHAMLHKSNPPFTIEELRELVEANK